MKTLFVSLWALAAVGCATVGSSSRAVEHARSSAHERMTTPRPPHAAAAVMPAVSVVRWNATPTKRVTFRVDVVAAASRPVPSTQANQVAARNTRYRPAEPALAPTSSSRSQGEGAADLRVTQQIHQQLLDYSSLSFSTKNVEVMTRGGRVTLRGPVSSANARAVIGAVAQEYAGSGEVDNQLEIAK